MKVINIPLAGIFFYFYPYFIHNGWFLCFGVFLVDIFPFCVTYRGFSFVWDEIHASEKHLTPTYDDITAAAVI